MDALHSDDPREGVIKSRILIIAGFLGAMTEWLQTGVTIAGRPLIPHAISSRFDRAFEWIAARQINGVALSQLNVNFGFNAAIFAIGGLLGIRIGVSFLVGAILNFCIFAPVFIPSGDIVLREGRNYYDILSWSVWTGAAMLTTASILPIVIDWRKVVTPLMAIFDRKRISATDVLARIEIPTRVSLIGIPIVSAIVIWLAHSFFDVSPFMGALAIPIAFVLSVIAANTTGHTGQTPSGPMGKITQLIYAGVAPNTITTNVMAAGISSDAAISGSSLLQDIKPGYMLGGKPRHQAIGHILGIITGSIAATIVAYPLFIESYVAHGKTTEWPLPSAEVWRTVASFLSGGVESLPRSAIVVAAIFAIAGIVLELHRRAPNSRIPLHPIGIGFAFVIPFWGSFMLFAGAFTFWLASVLIKRGTAQRVFVINRDTLCAGIFTGASIAGVILAMYQQGFFG